MWIFREDPLPQDMILFADREQQERRLGEAPTLGPRQTAYGRRCRVRGAGAHQRAQKVPIQRKDVREIVCRRSLILHRTPLSGV